MKISFVLPNLSPTGGVRVVFEYAERLRARGHEVQVIAPKVPPHLVRILRYNGIISSITGKIEASDIEWNSSTTTRRPTFLTTRSVQRVAIDADVLIATAWPTVEPVVGANLPSTRKYHFVQHYEIWPVWDRIEAWNQIEGANVEFPEVEMADIEPADRFARHWKKNVDAMLQSDIDTITISSWLETLLKEKFDKNVISMITNGVNSERFGVTNQNLRDDDNVRVLVPYRDSIWKGTADAIEALRDFDHKKVEVHMFGPSSGTVPDWVDLHVAISDEELSDLYAGSDIFLSPSWVEGCQLPPMEAMISECAVVATNVGGVPDYGIDGETLLAVPPRSPDRLRDAMRRLLENDELRGQLASNAAEHIQTFTWEAATDEFERAIQ